MKWVVFDKRSLIARFYHESDNFVSDSLLKAFQNATRSQIHRQFSHTNTVHQSVGFTLNIGRKFKVIKK